MSTSTWTTHTPNSAPRFINHFASLQNHPVKPSSARISAVPRGTNNVAGVVAGGSRFIMGGGGGGGDLVRGETPRFSLEGLNRLKPPCSTGEDGKRTRVPTTTTVLDDDGTRAEDEQEMLDLTAATTTTGEMGDDLEEGSRVGSTMRSKVGAAGVKRTAGTTIMVNKRARTTPTVDMDDHVFNTNAAATTTSTTATATGSMWMTAKKLDATTTTTTTGVAEALSKAKKPTRQERAEKHDKLVQESAQWRTKYKKAFPSFVFYFDALDAATELGLTKQVERLGASVDNFFSKKVTHVVTSRPVPTTGNNKENSPTVNAASKVAQSHAQAGPLGDANTGPIRTKKMSMATTTAGAGGPTTKSPTTYALPNGQKLRPFAEGLDKNPFIDSQDILCKAVDFKLKIWHVDKIVLILTRINSTSPTKNHVAEASMSMSTARHGGIAAQGLSLPSLLRDEQLYGTRERDPFVPRADMYYFGPKSVYLLVEDSTGEHRPIITKEYERPRRHEDPAWPVLWGGIEGRGGFYHYEGEIKYERCVPPPRPAPVAPAGASMQSQSKPLKAMPPIGGAGGHALAAVRAVGGGSTVAPNLRRSLSLQALHRGGKSVEVGARGASGLSKEPEYLAASGNSQIITSTTATSTRSGAPGGRLGGGGPAIVDKRLAVLSQRTVTSLGGGSSHGRAASSSASSSKHLTVPGAAPTQGKLKRSVSVDAGLNARVPPPREEPKKPGYCENCRLKYDDFKDHIVSSKHRRFAQNPKNWYELDALLSEISRPFAVDSSEEEDEEEEEDWDESDVPASQPSSSGDLSSQVIGAGDDSGFHEGLGSDSCASDEE